MLSRFGNQNLTLADAHGLVIMEGLQAVMYAGRPDPPAPVWTEQSSPVKVLTEGNPFYSSAAAVGAALVEVV